jgi:hypothetical protein
MRGWLLLGALAACWLASAPDAHPAPNRPPSPAPSLRPDYSNHLAQLRKRLPAGFTWVVQPPFVVVGDESAALVQRRTRDTVKWAVDRLKLDFFARDPVEIIDIWLFKNKASYDRYTRELFDDRPDTPFGYYSAEHHALIMNIETGGGTLVHEIVHPFVRANFPQCPAWFNEGLASLFEQCHDREGHIKGLPNWRLPGLQKAIRDDRVPSFPEMMSLGDLAFYGRTTATVYNQHYAQARYLCYYLQEQGLLTKYYREFQSNAKQDSTGVQTLKQVLGQPDLDAFKKKWEQYVLRLRFP